MAGLTRDTLFLALTRPAMKWGVPWEGFYINTVGTVFGGMILGSPLYWAAWPVIHLVMRAAVARDHNRFRIWRLWLETKTGALEQFGAAVLASAVTRLRPEELAGGIWHPQTVRRATVKPAYPVGRSYQRSRDPVR
jgi:type IV secretion system protein VirB3